MTVGQFKTEPRRQADCEGVDVSEYLRGRCRHLEVVPVESGGGLVARLCRTCDTQLPA